MLLKHLNDPKNAVLLQQTLDSARVTFENTQKITSDLDELTGDPKFRKNLLQLVNGLSKLVSSTQDIQQQVQVATTLDSVKAAVSKPNNLIPTPAPGPNKQCLMTSRYLSMKLILHLLILKVVTSTFNQPPVRLFLTHSKKSC